MSPPRAGLRCSSEVCGRGPPGLKAGVVPRQVEGERLQEHEAQRLREHLALLLGALLEAGPPLLSQGEQGWGASTPGPGAAPSQAAELLQRCEALERKTATFENIVCVLNREVERVAVTAEACGRQHRLDQDRIEALSNKVCARSPAVPRPRRAGARGSGGCRARSLRTAPAFPAGTRLSVLGLNGALL